MDPWACPSPGCGYRGAPAIHILEVMGKPGHQLSSADLSQTIEDVRRRALVERNRDTVALQAEIPVSLFEGQTVADIRARVLFRAFSVVSHAERMAAVRDDGVCVMQSPPTCSPTVPTALLTFRWYNHTASDPIAIWTLLQSWEAASAAVEVKLEFPNGSTVVLKDRAVRPTDEKYVPVPVRRPD